MEIAQRIFDLLKSKHKSKAELARYLGIRPTTVTEWDTKGKKPSVEYISRISEFLNVSCDYLLTGEEHHNSTNISHSAIGAFSNHSHGTVTMNTSSTETEMKMKADNQTEQAMSETSKELLGVFESLPMRERIKLLSVIYDYEEEYKKYGSTQIKQVSNISANEQQLLEIFKQFNNYEQAKVLERIKEWLDVKHRREYTDSQKATETQTPKPEFSAQTRIVACSFDGTYESRLATPEELEKMKLLKDAPEPEY